MTGTMEPRQEHADGLHAGTRANGPDPQSERKSADRCAVGPDRAGGAHSPRGGVAISAVGPRWDRGGDTRGVKQGGPAQGWSRGRTPTSPLECRLRVHQFLACHLVDDGLGEVRFEADA